MRDEKVTLAYKDDAYSFREGIPMELSCSGDLVRISRFRAWARRTWKTLTLHRYRHPRFITTAIDIENGIVTFASERWSWRRWRWERLS